MSQAFSENGKEEIKEGGIYHDGASGDASGENALPRVWVVPIVSHDDKRMR